MEGGDSEFANFTLPTLKAFLEAHVTGNKQQLAARAIGCPKTQFFRDLAIFWSAKRRKDTFLPPSIPLFLVAFILLRNSRFNFIHSVKQRLLRNRPGSDTATSRDFLRERLQRAFTRAN